MRLLKVRNTPCASTGKSKIGERAVIELLNSGFLGATRGQPLGFRLLSRSPLPRYGLRRRPPDWELGSSVSGKGARVIRVLSDPAAPASNGLQSCFDSGSRYSSLRQPIGNLVVVLSIHSPRMFVNCARSPRAL